MNRSQLPDAFSKTLESKPRQQREKEENVNEYIGGSSVNRLSRVFETTHLDKSNSTTTLNKPKLDFESNIDQTQLAFKDIRARFQQENVNQTSYRPQIPLKPSKTGPPALPEKIIIAAKTGPPALPVKPKLYNHRYDYNDTNKLHIPTTISRTTTGNSTTSTSSQNSITKQRGWNISNWFSTQQQQQQLLEHENLKNSIKRNDDINSISPQITGGSKRQKVIQELLETEKTYQKDMILLKEIYFDQASICFTKLNIKLLFSNLLDIIQFEKSFVYTLEQSCEQDSIGKTFREMMTTIDHIYSEYCKRHEDAVLKLQELEPQENVQSFLNKCKAQIQGKTTSWDLGSLLIKPVQRVLKYPLLLREILSLTSPTHIDHDDLSAAVKEIQEVADNINEIKRRKDIVEKIVGDKKKTDISVVHGINKRLTRRAQKFKQATGFAIEPTHDLLFEALNAKFEEQQEDIRQFARDVQGWVRHVKINFDNLQQLACSMESLYDSWGGVRVQSLANITDFNRMASYLSTSLSRELDNDVRGFVYSRIDDFLKVFENPTQVIHKRALKMIDYDRVRDMKSKGDIPDKALQESADAYVSINAQLVDELPKFFELTAKYFDILTSGLALVQLKFYGLMQREWVKLVEQNLGMQAASSFESIIGKQAGQLDKVEKSVNEMNIFHLQISSSNSSVFKQKSYEPYSPTKFIIDSEPFTRSSSAAEKALPPLGHASVENLIDLEQEGPVMTPYDFECIVLYDFETHEEDRLDVKRGTILRVSQHEDFIDQDWWYGTTMDDHRSGWVPITYCKRL